jgi:prepilin-type N-terminal cleavage/methylation domain-containing protein
MQTLKRCAEQGRAGFTLIEILSVMVLGAILISLVSVKAVESLSWSKQETAKKDLAALNAAVGAFKAEYGPLPGSGNNATHNQTVLTALIQKNLFSFQKIKVDRLRSSGSGMTFRFTEYFNARAPVEGGTTPDLVATWRTKTSSSQVQFDVE